MVVSFTECPESANPHSIIQDGKVVNLEGALLSRNVFKIHSDIMEDTAVEFLKDNPLLDEMCINMYPANVPDSFYEKCGSIEKTANARAANRT